MVLKSLMGVGDNDGSACRGDGVGIVSGNGNGGCHSGEDSNVDGAVNGNDVMVTMVV